MSDNNTYQTWEDLGVLFTTIGVAEYKEPYFKGFTNIIVAKKVI